MSDESIIEAGPKSSRFSRRSLIKAGAIVGGTIWVAPAIDSFTSPASAAGGPGDGSALHGCCACYKVNAKGSPTLLNAAVDGYNARTCAAACAASNPKVKSGTYVLFNTFMVTGFAAVDPPANPDGCFRGLPSIHQLSIQFHDTCPTGPPKLTPGYTCSTGTW